MNITAILAMDHSLLIGKRGGLPWHIPEDMKRFRELTMGHVVLMGKNTYFSLPESVRPLPNRRNIVMTHMDIPHIETFVNIDVCLASLRNEGITEMYLLGGASLYDQFFERGLIDRVELTYVDGSHEGDVYVRDFRDSFRTISINPFSGGQFISLEKI